MSTDFLSRLETAEKRDSFRLETAEKQDSFKASARPRGDSPTGESARASPKEAPMPPQAKLRSGTPQKGRASNAKAAPPKAPPKGGTPQKSKGATPLKKDASAAKKDDKAPAKNINVAKEILPFGFKVLGPIAAGAFSTIVRAKHIESGNEVAIKTFASCTGEQKEEHDRELEVLRMIADEAHAHIANLLGEYDNPSGTYAILSLCGGGSLNSHLGKLRKKQMAMVEVEAAIVTAQVASALQFLHGLGVAHRDIKPANVLYDGRRWRVCDFGFAIVCADRKLKKSVGTVAYCGGQESGAPQPCTSGLLPPWSQHALALASWPTEQRSTL